MSDDIRAHAQDERAWLEVDEDDPEVVIAARAIAANGFGRSWDDFLPTNAHDIDQSDLIEWARAAVAGLRAAASRTPAVKKGPYWTCCYCDASLSCAACGHEQPDDSEHYAAIERERDQLRAQVENARRQGKVSAFEEAAEYLESKSLHTYAIHIRRRGQSLSSTERQDG